MMITGSLNTAGSTELTPEQESKIPEYVDRWLKIGLSTDPVDFENCKKYAAMAYTLAGEKPPKDYYMVGGIFEMIELDTKLSGCTKIESLDNLCYGSHDASWLSFYSYFREVCDVKNMESLDGLNGLAQHCGWWCPREEYVIFSPKPSEIHMVEGPRGVVLHNENGPSVKYKDGFCIWTIDGYPVTEQIVMQPETLTIEQIDSERNADVQSIMLDRFGWDRYIKDSKARLVDERKNEIENTMEALYENKHSKRLVVTCPTGRLFFKGVPNEVNSCAEAQDWLGGSRKFNVIART